MDHREVVQRWYTDIFIDGDDAAIDELVAEDFIAHGPGDALDSHGREAFRTWLKGYHASFAVDKWTVHDMISEGDKIVARHSGWVIYRGGVLDIPSEGQRVRETGMVIFRIAGGQVQEIWSEMSDLQLMIQLGAFPCEEPGDTNEPRAT